jgi:beta-fructofuranosidase
MFECPDLFTIDGCDILVVSPEGMKDHPVSGYFAGKLDYATGRYEHEGFHLLDHGHHFYAPQTFQGPDGRRILIAWMPMKGSELGKSWSGSMTFPRELTLGSDRRLRFKPVDEIARLRQRATRQPPAPFRLEEGSLELGQGTELELIVTFNLRDMTAAQAGIRFFASSREEAILGYEAGTNALFVDYGHLSASPCERKSVSLGNGRPEELKLRLLLDHSAVEVFVNEGELAFSTLLFPGPDSRELSLFARGGCVDVEQLELYRLGQDL